MFDPTINTHQMMPGYKAMYQVPVPVTFFGDNLALFPTPALSHSVAIKAGEWSLGMRLRLTHTDWVEEVRVLKLPGNPVLIT